MSDQTLITRIEDYYREAFGFYDAERRIPAINVSFYPYIGINNTIRIREGKVFVRIAEICRDMPLPVQRALAYVLVSKLYRRRVPKAARELYGNYIRSSEMRDRSTESRRSRGRKMVSGAKGRIYDLDELFNDLNTKYFHGYLEKPTLTWSARKTYRILGHHDATHNTIVISKSLDSDETPRFVVEYVLFHEMLHMHHPTIHQNGRRYNHTPAFKRDERKFSHYHQAESWIEKNVRRLKRNAGRID